MYFKQRHALIWIPLLSQKLNSVIKMSPSKCDYSFLKKEKLIKAQQIKLQAIKNRDLKKLQSQRTNGQLTSFPLHQHSVTDYKLTSQFCTCVLKSNSHKLSSDCFLEKCEQNCDLSLTEGWVWVGNLAHTFLLCQTFQNWIQF